MKKKKSLSSIMVSISAFALTGLHAPPILAQVMITCSRNLYIGNNVQCSNKARLVISPDGSTNVATGCLFATKKAVPGKCRISTGGTGPGTKNVKVDFAKTFVNMNNGGKLVVLDNLKMQYKTTIPAASKFTFPPTKVALGINLTIGGTAHMTARETIGSYTGNVTVRAH